MDTDGRFVKLDINFIFFIENWWLRDFNESHGTFKEDFLKKLMET